MNKDLNFITIFSTASGIEFENENGKRVYLQATSHRIVGKLQFRKVIKFLAPFTCPAFGFHNPSLHSHQVKSSKLLPSTVIHK